MISENEIETYAVKLAEIGLDLKSLLAVSDRARDLTRDRERAARIAALPEEVRERLARLAAHPKREQLAEYWFELLDYSADDACDAASKARALAEHEGRLIRSFEGKVVAASSYAIISEDALQRMPWTRHLMTKDEQQRWISSRKEAGRAIDIETCELGRWHQYDCDVYGVHDLPPEMQQIGTNRYVRSPTSNGWINEEDLPVEKVRAMYDRIKREFEAYCREHPNDPYVVARQSSTPMGDMEF
jgi:hypothetical protein